MKVCYISPYRDGTGYSHSAIAHMLALDSVGVDVVARAVKMTPTKGEVPDRIKELEDKDLRGVDAVVQHNLPSEFSYKGGVINVGNFAYETSGFPNTDWKFTLGLMDKVIVPCSYQWHSLRDTCGKKIAKRTQILPHPVDTSKFLQQYEPMDFETSKSTVKFYTIAELGRRKNIPSLLTAYYSFFSISDDVILILKIYGPGRNALETMQYVENLCNHLKEQLGRFADKSRYPKVAVISQYLSDKHINSLHTTGDVFVTASHGEAISLPFVDAIGFGKPAIAPQHSAFIDYACPTDTNLLVDSKETVVFGVEGAPPGLYSGDERWGNVTTLDLGNQMRHVYENISHFKSDELVAARKQYVENVLSYEATGQKFKDILNAK